MSEQPTGQHHDVIYQAMTSFVICERKHTLIQYIELVTVPKVAFESEMYTDWKQRERRKTATRSLAHSLTHSLTHSRTHSLTHSRTHELTHELTFSLTYSLTFERERTNSVARHSPHAPSLELRKRNSTHEPTNPRTLAHLRTRNSTHELTNPLSRCSSFRGDSWKRNARSLAPSTPHLLTDSLALNLSIHQSINPSIHQSIHHSINQSFVPLS